MFGQPRCREWTPLATQQLRLRSLIQIVGYNIHGGECCTQSGSLYYTLHTTTMSAPFYTSEKLLSNHPKWREIDSELIHKMSSNSVVVRVWRHTTHKHPQDARNGGDHKHHQTDTVVQAWGVSFNGLLHIGANLALDFTPNSFRINTIVFQMIGGYFCSYDSLKLEPTSKLFNVEHTGAVSVAGKETSPSKKIPIEGRSQNVIPSRNINESKSVSPGKGWKTESFEPRIVSKSNSPPTGCFGQGFHSTKSVSSFGTTRGEYYRANKETGRERNRSDSYNNSIYEHSPKNEMDIEIHEFLGSDESTVTMKSGTSLSASSRDLHRMEIEESEQAENFDARLAPVPKCRYSSMKFLKSEIRPSYNAEKLQKLHLLQYSIKKRSQFVQDIKERIYQKSAMEKNDNLSPHGNLIDNNEDFSRSERLSVSCREFSLITGKNRTSSRNDLGKILSQSHLDLSKGSGSERVRSSESLSENREDESLPPDKMIKDKRSTSNRMAIDNTQPSDRRFTLPLNKLLEFKNQPSPSQRLRHLQLTRQAELSRFKRRLLQDERDSMLANIRQLRQQLGKLMDDNQDSSTDLMQKYHSLSRKWDQLRELKKSEAALKELCHRSAALLLARRWSIVQDLPLIYPITETNGGQLRILSVTLPPCRDYTDGLKQCSDTDLAVALGAAANLTALVAHLLGTPLRHPLHLMGSRTKVMDLGQNSEIPLFARNQDSMMFRYGLFLLNRNIAQLLWDTHRTITPDSRDTLGNLKRLMLPPTVTTGLDASRLFGSGSSMETGGGVSSTCPASPHHRSRHTSVVQVPSHSLRNMMPRHHHQQQARQFNRFKESVDGTSPRAAMINRKFRYSRSVGSCVEDQSMQNSMMNASTIGSEPSLSILDSQRESHKADVHTPSCSNAENIQTAMSLSESDLTKVTDIVSPESCSSTKDFSMNSETMVIFSVGDDDNTTLTNQTKANTAKLDVDRLTKEMVGLCNDYSKESSAASSPSDKISRVSGGCSLKCSESCNFPLTDSDFDRYYRTGRLSNSDSVVDETANCDCSADHEESVILNVGSFEAFENEMNEDAATISNFIPVVIRKISEEKQNSEDCHSKIYVPPAVLTGKLTNDLPCTMDIEKLGFPTFCSQPCSVKCPLSPEECPKVLRTGYDECENGNQVMHDVIVLPSAEAVMTTSSHFLDVQSEEQFSNNSELVAMAREVLKMEARMDEDVTADDSIRNDKTENDVHLGGRSYNCGRLRLNEDSSDKQGCCKSILADDTRRSCSVNGLLKGQLVSDISLGSSKECHDRTVSKDDYTDVPLSSGIKPSSHLHVDESSINGYS